MFEWIIKIYRPGLRTDKQDFTHFLNSFEIDCIDAKRINSAKTWKHTSLCLLNTKRKSWMSVFSVEEVLNVNLRHVNYWGLRLTLVYDYTWVETNFDQKKVFWPFGSLKMSIASSNKRDSGTKKAIMRSALNMHFQAPSPLSKMCFEYQGIIFNGF